MIQKRALVIAAHPDDIEFGAGATIAQFVADGWDFRYVIATRGQKGVYDARQDATAFGEIRVLEALEAARITGVNNVTFLDYMDSEVAYGLPLLRDLSRQFRIHRPHRLFVGDPNILPTDFFVNHPDHRAVAMAALDITVTGGTTAAIFPELVLEEDLEPWRDLEDIWIMGPAGGDTAVDVSSTIDIKLKALDAHVSQVTQDTGSRIRAWLHERGQPFGYEYAESFRVLRRRY